MANFRIDRISEEVRHALDAGRFDAAGYGLLAFGMVALSLGLDGLSGLGMGQAAVLLLMVFGLASVAAYWLHAARAPQPLFSPRLFAQPGRFLLCEHFWV